MSFVDEARPFDPEHDPAEDLRAVTRSPIRDLVKVREFVTAGRATFTVVSKKTGARRTFRARVNHVEGQALPTMWFVDLMTGPDNVSDFRYVGFYRQLNDGTLIYGHNKKGFAADAGTSLMWLARFLNRPGDLEWRSAFEEQCEFWHEGRCGRCGRTLTDPASIERGLGPVCDGR